MNGLTQMKLKQEVERFVDEYEKRYQILKNESSRSSVQDDAVLRNQAFRLVSADHTVTDNLGVGSGTVLHQAPAYHERVERLLDSEKLELLLANDLVVLDGVLERFSRCARSCNSSAARWSLPSRRI